LFIPKTGGINSRDQLINEAPVGTPATPQTNTVPLQSAPQQGTPAPKK
jgi:hypothetical protein